MALWDWNNEPAGNLRQARLDWRIREKVEAIVQSHATNPLNGLYVIFGRDIVTTCRSYTTPARYTALAVVIQEYLDLGLDPTTAWDILIYLVPLFSDIPYGTFILNISKLNSSDKLV